jgi:hypothetical protein
VAAAPESAAPLDAVAAALDAAAAMFEERRELAARRQPIIAANPELQERELIKLALARAVAEALYRRGVGDPAAILAAEAGVTVFRIAFERWVDPANRKDLQRLIRESLEELRSVTTAEAASR